MMTPLLISLLCLYNVAAVDSAAIASDVLPPLPCIGVAGAFTGFVGDRLVAGGGANFPDAAPWQGGQKKWHNTLYYLDSAESEWTTVKDALPRPVAYGGSVEMDGGLLCIGGCDADSCYADVFLIRICDGKVLTETFPPLPAALANMACAADGGKIFVVGGQTSMKEQYAVNHCFMLDVSDTAKGWRRLTPFPGEPRGYAVAVALNGDFYLFGGRDYHPDGYVKILTDGYVYRCKTDRWDRLAGEFPVMAGTAVAASDSSILLFGGSQSMQPGSDAHPGFDRTVRLYDIGTGMLTELCRSPVPLPVTTRAVKRRGKIYIPSGEIKPGVRTPATLLFECKAKP